MSIAKSQYLQAADLLRNPPSSVSIFMPEICSVETISTYKVEEKNALYFEEYIKKKMRDIRRYIISTHAQSLLQQLDQSMIESTALINDIKSRLYDAVENLNSQAQIIYLDKSSLKSLCQTTLAEPENLLIKNDIIDNLILQCIISPADLPSNTREKKAFISGNSKDFNTLKVKESLRNSGIRYFTITKHLLDWFHSRTLS